jgi:hypothetical protein
MCSIIGNELTLPMVGRITMFSRSVFIGTILLAISKPELFTFDRKDISKDS